jgi:hypothetical protein
VASTTVLLDFSELKLLKMVGGGGTAHVFKATYKVSALASPQEQNRSSETI